jgi:hypothetical protein
VRLWNSATGRPSVRPSPRLTAHIRRVSKVIRSLPGQVLAAGCLQEPSTAAGSVSVTRFRTTYGRLAKVSWPGQEGGRPGTGTMLLGCGR